MQTIVGMATIGQTPRIDVVPAIERILGSGVEAIEAGALDALLADGEREARAFEAQRREFLLY